LTNDWWARIESSVIGILPLVMSITRFWLITFFPFTWNIFTKSVIPTLFSKESETKWPIQAITKIFFTEIICAVLVGIELDNTTT